jgi:hypothetical protein
VLKAESVDLIFQNHLKPELGQKHGLAGAVDGNGNLGSDELPATFLDRLDADKDGFVSQQDFCPWARQRSHQAPSLNQI